MNEIVTQIDAQNKLEKSEVRMGSASVNEGSKHDNYVWFVPFTVCPSVSPFRYSWYAYSVLKREYTNFSMPTVLWLLSTK